MSTTHCSPAGRPTPTTFLLTFTAGDDAHLAAERLEQLAFRAVTTWLEDGDWELEAGALTLPATEAGALEHGQRVADCYSGRVDHVHGGWRPATLELVRPSIAPVAGERGELCGLWTRLTEVVANNEPSPLTTVCAEWAAELERRFDFEPPVDDGWITIDFGADGGES
jgi:hypothetical protein